MDDYSDDDKKTYSKENLVKVSVSQLQVGMHVVELDRPWLETPFMIQGFEIRHRSEVAKIAQYCDHVFVLRQGVSPKKQEPKQFPAAGPKPQALNTGTLVANLGRRSHKKRPLVRSRPAYDNATSVREEHPVARAAYGRAKSAAEQLLHSAQTGEMLDTELAERVVGDCVESIVRNPDAMVWMSKIKHEHEYTVEHSVNVCILAVVFARHLNFEEDELKKLGLCGLLHDVGKMKIPAEILDKPGDLTEDEFLIMKGHAVSGHKLLSETRGVSPLVIDVVLNHHERPDGSGYPRGLSSDEIPEYAKIISVVDAYDAMTSDSCYSRAESSGDAQRVLYENRGKQFDEDCALQFMQAIGPYPAGTLVELHNGMVAIVLAGRRKFRHLPSVILVLDKDKKRVEQKTVELHLTDQGGLDRGFLIKKALRDGTYDLRLEDFKLELEAAS